jgi:hypothetical protein
VIVLFLFFLLINKLNKYNLIMNLKVKEIYDS